MNEETQKEKYITPIAMGFMTTIVPDLFSEAFGAYKKRDFTRDYWQVSDWEKWYAGAAIALTASAIEANRNRFYHAQSLDISRRNVVQDIVNMFTLIKQLPNFPKDEFTSLIGEVFTVRDVIIHSHNYELEVEFRMDDWHMIDFQATRLEGYGDKKFGKLVDMNTFKTKLLGMNVLPTKIGFEELFIIILIFDLFVSITDKSFGKGYVAYHVHQNLGGYWISNLCELLMFYYDQLPSQLFKNRIITLSDNLRAKFGDYIFDGNEYFITNVCPKCQSLGFYKNRYLSKCCRCGLRIQIPHNSTSGQSFN